MARQRSNIIYVGPTRADASGGSVDAERVGGAADGYLRGRESSENFPVALRLLPRAHRTHLAAVYDVARVIDDLGDQAPGDRAALLRAFGQDLATIWAGGTPESPVLRRLAGTVAACQLSQRPFQALVEANVLDQTVTSYPTYADLVGYCELSANPVGHLVLEIFGAGTPENVALSDRICTALQIIEHCQDVGEDRRAGRIYLPLEDLDRFGVAAGDLDAAQSASALRALVEFEAHRCAALLRSGEPLLRRLHGWARLAVTGYVAGGHAALGGLRRGGWGVLPTARRGGRLAVVGQVLAVTMRRGAPQ